MEDDDVKKFINWCLSEPDKRPTAAQLLESEFLNEEGPNDGVPVKLKRMPTTRRHTR